MLPRLRSTICCRPSVLTLPQPQTFPFTIISKPSTSLPPSPIFFLRSASSASTRWKSRQTSDPYTRASKLAGLKSRAAFKLLEIDERHHLFRRGATVVDLGYAPGSWSQVAFSRVKPGGRVVGIDVIPAQPPRGVNALQGDFLRGETRERLREFLRDTERGRVGDEGKEGGSLLERIGKEEEEGGQSKEEGGKEGMVKGKDGDDNDNNTRVVDVVLSDMSAPWPLEFNSWVKSVSNPYIRMMNTSGMAFRDHAGSMDLCLAALDFCCDTLVTGGHFVCKFYAGSEDHALEMRLKKLFEKVHRIKPDSSRKESKEAYFIALRRKADVPKEVVFGNV